MDRKIRVGAVSYLNTKPLIYGFEQGLMDGVAELSIDYPAKVAEKLLSDEIDIGLVPVAIIPRLAEYHVISDYCIGCNGEVSSVCLFSDVPIHQVETILLDYQSRTSVALLKILLKEHWKVSPELVTGTAGYEKSIGDTTAGLVIGDRALQQHPVSKYSFDLGQAWKDMTGLPFVFAAWISNKKLPASFEEVMNRANQLGLDQLDLVIKQNPGTGFDLEKYYRSYIKFRMDMPMRGAIALFLDKLNKG